MTTPAGSTILSGITRAPQGRRLDDKIIIAFHRACDQSDYVVAEQLLVLLDFMTERTRRSTSRTDRRGMEILVALYERLWLLKHMESPLL